MDQWEDLYESHAEQQERYDMEVEMFGEALDDDALTNELDNLEALDVEAKMEAPIGTGAISADAADAYREKNGLNAAAETSQPAADAAPKRQLVAA